MTAPFRAKTADAIGSSELRPGKFTPVLRRPIFLAGFLSLGLEGATQAPEGPPQKQ